MSPVGKAEEAKTLATKQVPGPTRGLRKIYRRFQAFDRAIDNMKSRLAHRFSHGSFGRCVLEFFEPAASGFAMAFLLLLLDGFRGDVEEGRLSLHFVSSTASHVEPLLFPVAFLALSLTLVLAGSEVGRLARRLLVLPVLRFVHHALMLAIGAVWIFIVKEALQGKLSATDLLRVSLLTLFGFMVAFLAYAAVLVASSELAKRLEVKFKSFRWMLTALGFVLTIAATSDVQRALLHAETQAAKGHGERSTAGKARDEHSLAPVEPGASAPEQGSSASH